MTPTNNELEEKMIRTHPGSIADPHNSEGENTDQTLKEGSTETNILTSTKAESNSTPSQIKILTP